MKANPPTLSIVASPAVEGRAGQVLMRLPVWLGLAAGVLLALLIAIRPVPAGVRELDGSWSAAIVGDEGALETTRIELPGLMSLQGIAPDARIHASRDVQLGAGRTALLVDTPLYALTVTWDGRALVTSGDPTLVGRQARSSQSVFAVLPDGEPGSSHRLGLDLRGDYGKGGITGRILMGPAAAVHAAGRAVEVQRIALSLGLCLLGILPLVVAARGPWRPTYVSYGLFSLALALMSFCQSNLVYEVLPDALAVLRMLRSVAPLVAPLGLAVAATYRWGRLGRGASMLLGVGVCLAVAGAVAPPAWLYSLEVASDSLYLFGFAGYVAICVDAVRHRIHGSRLLAAAVLPFLWAIGSEVLLTHGLRTGSSHVLASALLFAVALGAVIVLRDAEVSEQHERLVRGSLDAMVTVDAEGHIQDVNPAAGRLLDTSNQLLSLVAEPDRPVVRAHLARALLRSDRSEFHTIEGRVFESLATALGNRLLLLTLRDITQRRDMDRGLLQAARMETVGLLLGGIAHDFNNMLSSLLAHLGLLRVQLEDNEPAIQRIDRLEGTVDRASELTRRLLTVARGTGSELGPCNLVQVLEGAAELVEPTLQPGVELKLQIPADLPPVLGDVGDLEQVVVNLLVNARDAVGPAGHLRLAAVPFVVGRGRGVAVMVEDDGPGIPEDRKEDVFQPFVTTKPTGTGLGLAVARQILADHHGRIWVEDRPEGGTRFLLALRHADAVDEAPAPLPAGRRVVLVEDEPVLLEDYVRALSEGGYDVRSFTTANAAASELAASDLDVLVTDVVMPGMNGLELAGLCQELHPEVPILLVSAFIPDRSLRHVIPDGRWTQLHKPIRAARLVSTVGTLRRRAERLVRGDDDITHTSYLFPDLGSLTARSLAFPPPQEQV